jgi:hypothetical protein
VLVIDAANVVGSRPDGWWRDRAGAAARFVDEVRRAARAGLLDGDEGTEVVVVLEGAARSGTDAGAADGVDVVLAAGSGDDAIVDVVRAAARPVTVVTADRELARRVAALDAQVVGPRWLRSRLDVPDG